MQQDVMNLQAQLTGMYAQVSQSVVEFAPKVVGALVILVIGYVIAQVLKVITRAIVSRFDPVFKKMLDRPTTAEDTSNYAFLFGKVIFWIVILFFLTAAVNFLGWEMASDGMASLIGYLPNFISGLLIIFLGFMVSNLLKTATIQAAQSANIDQYEVLGQAVRVMVLLTAFIIGVQQAGIDVEFISTVLTVVIGLSVAGFALAFGLGGKDAAANFMGAQHAKKHLRVGDNVRIGQVEGRLAEVTHSSIILDTTQGRTMVPAKLFHQEFSSCK